MDIDKNSRRTKKQSGMLTAAVSETSAEQQRGFVGDGTGTQLGGELRCIFYPTILTLMHYFDRADDFQSVRLGRCRYKLLVHGAEHGCSTIIFSGNRTKSHLLISLGLKSFTVTPAT